MCARIVAAGLVNLAVGVVYPFLIYLLAVVAALYWLHLVWQEKCLLWRQGGVIAATFVIPLPLYLHYAATLRTNAAFGAWDAQALTPSLPWPHYLVAYGPMIFLGLLEWRKRPAFRSQSAILWVWILAVVLLLQAPLPSQRRFVQGVHVPLSVLAAAGMVNVALPWLARTRTWRAVTALPRYETEPLSRLLIVLFLMSMSMSNLYVLLRMSVTAVVEQPDTLFRPVAEIESVDWLRHYASREAVVMADYLTGNYIAAHAGTRVVLGHWAETLDYAQKERSVALFYSSGLDQTERRQLLSLYQVDYVWFGPRERELGNFDPRTATFLRSVYENATITIYAVQ
jgi:hypothetical protein